MALFSADMRIVLLLRVTQSSIQEMGPGLTEPRVEETGGVRLFRAYSQDVSFATCRRWIHRNEVWLKSSECTAGSVVGCIPGCRSNAHLPRQKSPHIAKKAKNGPPVLSLSGFRDRGRYFLQLSLTILMLVTLRWPCSVESLSTPCSFISSLTFSLAPCRSAARTLPVTVTV